MAQIIYAVLSRMCSSRFYTRFAFPRKTGLRKVDRFPYWSTVILVDFWVPGRATYL